MPIPAERWQKSGRLKAPGFIAKEICPFSSRLGQNTISFKTNANRYQYCVYSYQQMSSQDSEYKKMPGMNPAFVVKHIA